MIIQAATVGLCTSFVCGNIDESNSIKEHFNYLEKPVLCHKTWPNFSLIKNWNKQFYEKPCGISTIDIGSLYPIASLKKIPDNTPLFYSRFTIDDYNTLYSYKNNFYHTLHFNRYCANVKQNGNQLTDCFKL
jgi:hypothetical protein